MPTHSSPLSKRIKVLDVELSRPITAIEGLEGYDAAQLLVRLHGTPLEIMTVPLTGGCCTAPVLSKALLDGQSWTVMRHLLRDALDAASTKGLQVDTLANAMHAQGPESWPLVTVAVCTRDRDADLLQCLEALGRLDYPALDLLVVDNAPANDATERLVQTRFLGVRYVREPRPGLNWARNRAVLEARGEIIAYTDDDVIVDAAWVRALAAVFAENPDVAALTGLVVPHELETEAQRLFERYGGFGRGFARRFYRGVDGAEGVSAYGAGRFGTGANMAYRRSLFDEIGLFDPALDVGTVTNGGGDLEMFFRVLKTGHTLVYEPSAVVRHRHRREYAQLRTQLANNGIGFYSYVVRSAKAFPDERSGLLRFGLWWFWHWSVRRLLISFVRPGGFPRELILTELRGCIAGLFRYQTAARAADEIARTFGPLTPAGAAQIVNTGPHLRWRPARALRPSLASGGLNQDVSTQMRTGTQQRLEVSGSKRLGAVPIRTVDLCQPLFPIADVEGSHATRVYVMWRNRPLGTVGITNHGRPIGVLQLLDAVVDTLGLKLLEPDRNFSEAALWSRAFERIARRFMPAAWDKVVTAAPTLPADVSVSVVIATFDRPDDLRHCLRCLVAQASARRVELIVVDNHPPSGLTPPVVADFPSVQLVNEPRQGLSYGRNKGIVTSTGDIVIAIDDDVTLAADWLEKLVAPFSRPDVMVVTGNVLPFELETPAQHLFEVYGGLGRGFAPRVFDRAWFQLFKTAVPTWDIGATANAAFRATIFGDPEIGLLDEALGAGTPTGCSEDTDLFYKVLKAGHTIVYEPSAYVWHKHRRDMRALRRQLYNYSKGHVAYHLTTLRRDGDLRALVRLGIRLPQSYFMRIKGRLRGWSSYPIRLMVYEFAGSLAGPWCLWRSRRRVRRLGRSAPYVSPAARRRAPVPEPALAEADASTIVTT